MKREEARVIAVIMIMAILSMTGLGQAEKRALGLEECLGRIGEKHPLIQAARRRVEGADEFSRYAGVRPNPTLTIQTENWRVWQKPPFSLPTDIDLFIYGTQRLEVAGKAGLRRDLALRSVDSAEREVEVVQRRLWLEIVQRYQSALRIQSLLTIGEENRRDLDQLVALTTTRFREGYVAEWEVIRVELERQTLLNQQSLLEQELVRTKLDLLQSMGETTFQTDFQLVEPPLLDSLLMKQSVEELQAEAVGKRAEISLLRARIERERANLSLQRANARPDLEVVGGYKRTGGYNTMMGYLTVPLPLFNKNRGEIGRAAAEVSSVEMELLAQTNYVRAEVEAGYRAIHQLETRLREMERDFLTRADSSREIALTAYREGAADLYKLLESQRARNEAHRLFYQTKLDLQMALAALSLIVGRRDVR